MNIILQCGIKGGNYVLRQPIHGQKDENGHHQTP